MKKLLLLLLFPILAYAQTSIQIGGDLRVGGKLTLANTSVINIRDYGAVGNGTTDDASAIQSAINAGTVIYIPKGNYKVGTPLTFSSDSITVFGDGAGVSNILFSREQTAADTVGSMQNEAIATSCLVFGLPSKSYTSQKIYLRDFRIRYTGSWDIVNTDATRYNGRSSGILFGKILHARINNVEVSNFNAMGISIQNNVMGIGYSEDIVIDGCYLHHNRVAGVRIGYVDGMVISNCELNYNGSSVGGGTGYGFTSYSSAMCKNITVHNNRANYNWRKGIDFHSGENIIITGNTVKGNKLYGIDCEWTVAPTLGEGIQNVIVSNNIISEMSYDSTYFPSPYTWIAGMYLGVAKSGALDTNSSYNIKVTDNIIDNIGLTTQNTYPLYANFDFTRGMIDISRNQFKTVRTVTQPVISLLVNDTSVVRNIMLKLRDNQIQMSHATNAPIKIYGFSEMDISGNQIVIDSLDTVTGYGYFVGRSEITSLVFIGNQHRAKDFTGTSMLNSYSQPWMTSRAYMKGNWLNGGIDSCNVQN